MTALRPGLPELPPLMRHLPIDERGYPVPFFVALIDGKPDHRVADGAKMPRALKNRLCWLCGLGLGSDLAFVIGPMCSVTRTISEPPSHPQCARFAAVACPFMTRPRAKRRAAGLEEVDDLWEPAGFGLKRNPGAVCVWTTKRFTPFRAQADNPGLLFELGEPISTEWFAEGRPATREEVEQSVESGLPLLMEGITPAPGETDELAARLLTLQAMLDRQFGPRAAAA